LEAFDNVPMMLSDIFDLNSLISFCHPKNKTMKTTKLNSIALGMITLLFLISCSKDDDNSGNNTKATVENNVQNGTWRITKFIDSGKDEINHFTGYNFTFQSSGVLNANNGTNNYDGTWSITDSNSNDDSKDDLDFNINYNLTNDFEDLNDDWDFISQSATKIELIHISGGNGGTDYLTFEKN
tara:strand:+ start:7140 stop:7688 length:549 start_codon:yes stop_codon:yes gene_type:complete